MSDSIRDGIEKRARSAIIQRALFRVENAFIIAGSLLLAAFFPQPFPQTLPWFDWWTWLLIGLIGVAGVVVASLSDPKERQQAVADMFHEEHDAKLIKDKNLRAKYDRALEYYDNIQEVSGQMKTDVMRERTGESVRQMEEWVSNIYRLALRLQAFKNDGIINRDRIQTPKAQRELEARLKLETDASVRQQLQTNIESKKQQGGNIAALDSLMERAELQLDHSVAALGTVYSQMLLISGKREIDSAAASRLQEDVSDEVASLQDLVESINQVYDYRFEGYG
ncbi:MAG: DUF4149 domain-containing protein [Caldilineales bacterium]|nr:DUF4149 domain-containing protein [Caldilineales bacterium]